MKKDYEILRLCDIPSLKDGAAAWFAEKWKIPESEYEKSITESIYGKSPVPQWYVAVSEDKIIAGLGVIENDFHARKDLTPNVCAVYTEKEHRNRGIAGALLDYACTDMAKRGIKTLYLQSYTVDNPYDKNRIPDQTDGSADNRTIYAFQEDNSFGVNTYQIDYRQLDNEISMVMKNEDPVKFAFITAVKKNNLVMSLQIIDKGSYLITYILAQMKFPALSIFESKMNNSLNARITALQNWFEESYFAAKITQEEIKE